MTSGYPPEGFEAWKGCAVTVTADTETVDNPLTEAAAGDGATVIGIDAGVRSIAKRVSLVVPARNEARNLSVVLSSIPDCVDDVVLVDGNSRDATVAMAVYCRPDVRVISQDAPGKGVALRAGFRAATGDIIVMLDADGSMSPQEIPHYLWYLDHGFDFVKGSRFVAGGGSADITRLRRLGNRGLLVLVNLLYDARLTDLCYGFCAFRRCWLDSLDLQAVGFEIETEMVIHALRAGLRIAEVPSFELPRRSGRSGLRTFRDGWRVLETVIGDRRAVGRELVKVTAS